MLGFCTHIEMVETFPNFSCATTFQLIYIKSFCSLSWLFFDKNQFQISWHLYFIFVALQDIYRIVFNLKIIMILKNLIIFYIFWIGRAKNWLFWIALCRSCHLLNTNYHTHSYNHFSYIFLYTNEQRNNGHKSNQITHYVGYHSIKNLVFVLVIER